MKKSVKNLLLVVLGAIGMVANQAALADQASCAAAPCDTSATPLSVNFSINIPAFLRFQVGETAATSPSVQWNAGTITAANIGTGNVNADTVLNGGLGGPTLVDYALVSNLSTNNATVTATGTAAAFVSGGNSIPYTDVNATTAATTGAGIALPVPGSATSVVPTSGVINEAGTWQYYYVNNAIYPAGTYTGTINYTVAQP